jgi:hypothetical protein
VYWAVVKTVAQGDQTTNPLVRASAGVTGATNGWLNLGQCEYSVPSPCSGIGAGNLTSIDVHFNRDVSQCAIVAVLGATSTAADGTSGGGVGVGFVKAWVPTPSATTNGFTSPNVVRVATYNTGNSSLQQAFHLWVTC